MSLLTDKVAVVTGVSRGIGWAVVNTFLEHGAHVLGVSRRDPPRLESSSRASAFRFLRGDIGTQETVDLLAEAAAQTHGRIDILVNNAAIDPPPASIDSVTQDDWLGVLQINLLSVARISTRLLPLMRSTRGGRIVNIGSVLSIYAAPSAGPYVVSKHALLGLTRQQALEYGRMGITANCVLPGAIDTEMFRSGDPDGEWRRYVESRCPLGRMADPREIAATVLFLASPLSSYINGATLVADGGLTLGV